MYQIIVVGLGLSLILGGSYYVAKTDNYSVLGNTLTENTDALKLSTEDIAGNYVCAKTTGCANPYTLTLDTDGAATLHVTYENGVETKSEQGLWSLITGGFVSLTLTGPLLESDDSSARTFLIQSVSTSTLGKLVFDEKVYTDMVHPTFVREE